MAAPIGHRIELDTVGELHLVFLVKFPDLLFTLRLSVEGLGPSLLVIKNARVLCKLVFLQIFKCASARSFIIPSSVQPCR